MRIKVFLLSNQPGPCEYNCYNVYFAQMRNLEGYRAKIQKTAYVDLMSLLEVEYRPSINCIFQIHPARQSRQPPGTGCHRRQSARADAPGRAPLLEH